MSTKTPAPESVSSGPVAPPPVSRTISKWDAFAQAGLAPLQVICQTYYPYHLQDSSCHSKLPRFTSDQLQTHIDGDHGAGFELYLKKVDGKASGLWGDLSSAGLEVADLRCGVCSKQLPLRPSTLLQHMRPHSGNTKQSYRQATTERTGCVGMIQVTLTSQRPDGDSVDDLEPGS